MWLAADNPDCWKTYRVLAQEEDNRFIEELAPEEIIAAARTIQSDDAMINIVRTLGMRRLRLRPRPGS